MEFSDIESVIIMGINYGSLAENAGIKQGDVIVEVDGKPVSTSEQLLEIIQAQQSISEPLLITLHRRTSNHDSVLQTEIHLSRDI